MGINLTPGSLPKLMTGKCTTDDLYKPVVQVIDTDSRLIRSKDDKQWYSFVLSNGSFSQIGWIPGEIIILKNLQKGSIVRLFGFVSNLKSGDPKPLPYNETLLMEKSVPPILDQEHADSDLNEDVDDSHRGEEPPALKQNPSDSTQNCSSHSLSQSKKRKCQSSNDNISTVLKDISKIVRTMMERNKENGVDACYKKLEKLEEDFSKMTKLMMEKSKEVDAGFKKLETLEEDVSKMMKLMMEKNKEDDAGSCFKKLEALGEDVCEMSRMMMKICKEDDMGACIKKLEKLGWGAQDPMYDTALLLFSQSADYRNLWLHLKPESCGNWVKNAGSIFGLLD